MCESSQSLTSKPSHSFNEYIFNGIQSGDDDYEPFYFTLEQKTKLETQPYMI